jgi:L-seryl-tRNA(Ser) seleniumtransferase
MDFNKIGEYLEKIPQFEIFREKEQVKKMIEKNSEGDVYDKFNEISEKKHRDIVTADSEEMLESIDISEEMFLKGLKMFFHIEEGYEDREYILEKEEKDAILNSRMGQFPTERKSFTELLPELKEKKEELKGRYKRVVNCLGIVKSEYIGKNIYPETVLEEFKKVYSKYTNYRFSEEKGDKRDITLEIEKILSEKFGEREFFFTNRPSSAAYLVFDTISKGKKVIMSAGDNVVFEGENFGISDAAVKAGAELKIVGYHNSIKTEDYIKEIGYDSETAVYGDFIENTNSSFDVKRAESFEAIKEKVKTVYIGNRVINKNFNNVILNKKTVSMEEIFSRKFNVYILDLSKLEGFPEIGVISADKPIMKKIKENSLSEFVKAGECDTALFHLCCLDIFSGKEKGSIEKSIENIEEVEKKNSFFMGKLKYEVGEKAEIEKVSGNYLQLTEHSPEEMKIKSELVSVKTNKKTAAEIEKEFRNTDPIVLCWLQDDTLIFNLALVNEDDIEYIVKIAAGKIKKSRYIKKSIDK